MFLRAPAHLTKPPKEEIFQTTKRFLFHPDCYGFVLGLRCPLPSNSLFAHMASVNYMAYRTEVGPLVIRFQHLFLRQPTIPREVDIRIRAGPLRKLAGSIFSGCMIGMQRGLLLSDTRRHTQRSQ
ncbi:hypothetical protein BJY00DRAFT_281887 [Aspergillus carlsbadensis]|nr:hypothetical protein BJY00DRAFT_281887 [Aspergillus carlsbadensis]